LTLPILDALRVERESSGLAGIKGSNLLNETAIAGVALIGDDHAVEGALFGTVTSETNVDSHVALKKF
jgi:hypothetical protein